MSDRSPFSERGCGAQRAGYWLLSPPARTAVTSSQSMGEMLCRSAIAGRLSALSVCETATVLLTKVLHVWRAPGPRPAVTRAVFWCAAPQKPQRVPAVERFKHCATFQQGAETTASWAPPRTLEWRRPPPPVFDIFFSKDPTQYSVNSIHLLQERDDALEVLRSTTYYRYTLWVKKNAPRDYNTPEVQASTGAR